MNYCEEKCISTSELNEAQRTLYYTAENMKMNKSISEEGYEHFQHAIKALEQEPILEKDGTLIVTTKHCENVGRVLVQYGTNGTLFYQDQEPRKGHWQVVSDGYSDNAYICECSECKDTVWVYKNADRKWNYCPNCGADMRE